MAIGIRQFPPRAGERGTELTLAYVAFPALTGDSHALVELGSQAVAVSVALRRIGQHGGHTGIHATVASRLVIRLSTGPRARRGCAEAHHRLTGVAPRCGSVPTAATDMRATAQATRASPWAGSHGTYD